MLIRSWIKVPFVLIALAALSGCAAITPVTHFPEFAPHNLSAEVQAGRYVQKVDTFMVVFDGSHSMEARYGQNTLLNLGTTTLHNFNATIPNLQLHGGLHVFGHESCVNSDIPMMPYPLGHYTRSDYADAIDAITCGYGLSHMAEAIGTAHASMKYPAGHSALVVISDGEAIAAAPVLNAVGAMKGEFGERLCVYTIQVGNDPEGGVLLTQMTEVAACGRALNADNLLAAGAMADFVREIFLADAPPPPAPVAVTPEPRPVPIIVFDDNIMFDFDKAVIRPAFYPVLDEAVALLKDNSELNVEIAGHTCSMGPAEYNLGLSQRRAQAVKNYLVEKGIATERMVVKGYGLTQPAYSNDTREGRAKNRRTEIIPIK